LRILGGNMIRRILADWPQIIAQQQNSELSIIALCKENQLPALDFYKYQARLQDK
jgi:hypothetical protein